MKTATETFLENSGWNIAFQPLLGMWGIRGAGSQVNYTLSTFLRLFAFLGASFLWR